MKLVAKFAALITGVLMVVGSLTAWTVISSELKDQNITVAEDASCSAGKPVDGPISAYCQQEIINHHALKATGGKTYAELDQKDPVRTVAANASFLRASLFTSVLAYGVALLALGTGLCLTLVGLALPADKK